MPAKKVSEPEAILAMPVDLREKELMYGCQKYECLSLYLSRQSKKPVTNAREKVTKNESSAPWNSAHFGSTD